MGEMRKGLLIWFSCGWLVLCSVPVQALVISYNDLSGGAIKSVQMDAFREAATFWESLLSDSTTVRIDIDMQALGPGVIGSSRSYAEDTSYTALRTALIADVTSAFDLTAVGSLQEGDFLDVVVNDLYRDDKAFYTTSGDVMNASLRVNRANLKALNLLGDDGNADSSILMSSDFAFDYDRRDGISGGSLDFVGVMVHEIGHSLGFVSGVDTLDFLGGDGPLLGVYDWSWSGRGIFNSLEDYALFSVLDLYRYSDYVSAVLPGYLDWSYDSLSGGFWGDSYFSIDGGKTASGALATGYYNGDGHQASHWKDNLGLGRLDPTLGYGESFELLTSLDRQAFDVIGWDVRAVSDVPEPETLVLFGIGLLGLLGMGMGKSRGAGALPRGQP